MRPCQTATCLPHVHLAVVWNSLPTRQSSERVCVACGLGTACTLAVLGVSQFTRCCAFAFLECRDLAALAAELGVFTPGEEFAVAIGASHDEDPVSQDGHGKRPFPNIVSLYKVSAGCPEWQLAVKF
jgi:hypothetical protein